MRGPSIACAPPTLYRYPGPCGLADWFAGELRSLAPGPVVWMSAATWCLDSLGAHWFGTLAILEPWRLDPVLVWPGIYAGDAAAPPGPVVWLPPSLLSAPDRWSRLARVTAAERPRVVDELCLYLEELDLMRRSGAPGPGVPWLAVPEEERRWRLAEAGVAPVWTAARRVKIPA